MAIDILQEVTDWGDLNVNNGVLLSVMSEAPSTPSKYSVHLFLSPPASMLSLFIMSLTASTTRTAPSRSTRPALLLVVTTRSKASTTLRPSPPALVSLLFVCSLPSSLPIASRPHPLTSKPLISTLDSRRRSTSSRHLFFQTKLWTLLLLVRFFDSSVRFTV